MCILRFTWPAGLARVGMDGAVSGARAVNALPTCGVTPSEQLTRVLSGSACPLSKPGMVSRIMKLRPPRNWASHVAPWHLHRWTQDRLTRSPWQRARGCRHHAAFFAAEAWSAFFAAEAWSPVYQAWSPAYTLTLLGACLACLHLVRCLRSLVRSRCHAQLL